MNKISLTVISILSFVSILLAGVRFDEDPVSKNVKEVGVEDSTLAFFNLCEGFATNLVTSCSYGNVYIDLTLPTGKAFLAMLMAAKINGQKITRIAYDQRSNNRFYLIMLRIE